MKANSNWYVAFGDGSLAITSQSNSGTGAYASIIVHKKSPYILQGWEEETTSSDMEVKAFYETLRHLPPQSQLVFYTDSLVLITIFERLDYIISSNFRKCSKALKKEKLIWKKINRQVKRLKEVRCQWAPSHLGFFPLQDKVDEIARQLANDKSLELMANHDFHNKYRPVELDQVIGQESTITSLSQFKADGKWPHAYLFIGDAGCGKTTLGRIIARELGCDFKSNLTEIDAASNSGAEAMRNFVKGLGYTGFGDNPIKVIIIDECHALSKQAWQVLLKPLEEPQHHVYFILCTTEATTVPKTIKTRCQQYNIKPIPEDDLFELISFVAEEEEISFARDEKMLGHVAEAANGSARAALTLLSAARGCQSEDELLETLEMPGENSEVVELCRLLIDPKRLSWKTAMICLNDLPNVPNETIRLQVVNYVNAVIKSAYKNESKLLWLLTVLEAFTEKGMWLASEKLAPLYLALGTLLMSEEE